MPNSKQWKIPTWETRALESWLYSDSYPSKLFGKMRALVYMKSKVFWAYGCTLKKYSSMDVDCQTPFTSLSIMAPAASPLFLAPAQSPCPGWTDPTQPRNLQLVLFPLPLFEAMWLNHYCVFGLCFLTLEWSKHLSSSTFTFGNHRKGGQM